METIGRRSMCICEKILNDLHKVGEGQIWAQICQIDITQSVAIQQGTAL